jgi:antitoxin FitA
VRWLRRHLDRFSAENAALCLLDPLAEVVNELITRAGATLAGLAERSSSRHDDCNEGAALEAIEMAQLTVRKVDDRVVRALKQRAASRGRSAEAEHREILRAALLQDAAPKERFAVRAARLRSRLRSDLDSAALVRADRDRDTAG